MSKINIDEFIGGHPGNTDDDEYRVLTVKRVGGGLRFREACDDYYEAFLTPDEVRAFAAKLIEMLDEPEPETLKPFEPTNLTGELQ